ncbi:MAG: hypothetical protein HC813_03325 [Planctomycetes bacterium]|nr:hypothetical protein [Planctomycetota bacterium]
MSQRAMPSSPRPSSPAGSAVERSKAWEDPIYLALMRRSGTEILPGYFDVEAGVTPIPLASWSRERDGGLVHVVSDPAVAMGARYLVLSVEMEGHDPFVVTRIAPFADTPGLAEASSVRVAGRGVVAIPLEAFDGEGAILENRQIPASRSSLLRLEIRPAVEGIPFGSPRAIRLKGAIWAARPPSDGRAAPGPSHEVEKSEGTEGIR